MARRVARSHRHDAVQLLRGAAAAACGARRRRRRVAVRDTSIVFDIVEIVDEAISLCLSLSLSLSLSLTVPKYSALVVVRLRRHRCALTQQRRLTAV